MYNVCQKFKEEVVLKKILFAVLPLAAGVCLADGSPSSVTSAWSTATCVDTRADAVRFAKVASPVAYAPRYSGGTAVDHVVLRKVQYAGTSSAVTNVVETFAAGAEGGYAFSFAADDERCYRLLHTAYDANDAQVGETLAADVAFAVTGTGAANALVDTRENALQLVADDLAAHGGGTVPLAYSTDWATNGTPARVEVTCERAQKAGAATKTLVDAQAPATGDAEHAVKPNKGGTYTFTCSFYDMAGKLLGEPLTAFYGLKEHLGLIIVFR